MEKRKGLPDHISGDELPEFLDDDGDDDIRFDNREEGHIYESIEDELALNDSEDAVYEIEELDLDDLADLDLPRLGDPDYNT